MIKKPVAPPTGTSPGKEVVPIKKIDFEAHYYTPFFQGLRDGRILSGTPAPVGPGRALIDLAENRLRAMDENGIDIQVISFSVGLELLPPKESAEIARRVNDTLAEAISRHPDRFRGFAQLPVLDVEAALLEMERCTRDLNFVGWNTFSNFNGAVLAEPRFFPLLEQAEQLGLFLYLHPTEPAIPAFKGWSRDLEFGLGYHFDTCISLMKLIAGGVFDRLPNLKVILGHLGETWPFMYDRLNSKSIPAGQAPIPALETGGKNKRRCSDYWRTNLWASTSGNLSKAAFTCAKEVLGIEHLLLGTDYPYESLPQTMEFLDSTGMTREEAERLYHKNAEEFFGIQ